MKQTLQWRLVWPNFVSQCWADRVSLTVTKHLDFCSTFYKADVTSRALSSHFVSWFLVLDASRHILPMGNLGPKGNSYDSCRCYPGRSSLIPIRRALSPRILELFHLYSLI